MYDNPPTLMQTQQQPIYMKPPAKKLFVTYSPTLLVKKAQFFEQREKELQVAALADTDSNGAACNDMSHSMSVTRDTGLDVESMVDGLTCSASLAGDATPTPSAQPTCVSLNQLFDDTDVDHISASGFDLISNEEP